MTGDISNLTDFNRILHSPARLTIIALLAAVEEADFTFLLKESGLTKGNLSSNLSKLEQTSYIEIEKTYKGKIPLTLCRLTDDGRAAFKEYRNQMKKFIDITGQ